MLASLSISFYFFHFFTPLALAGMENASGHHMPCGCTDAQPFIQVRAALALAQSCILQMSE